MGQGVDAALKTIIGDDELAQLQRDGRYQRDVY
jgi:sulfite reductase alpha subunit-like flavoprotein